ncbi:MAG: hypothetical protein AAGL49_09820, partial [Pseudomonadota bacterium]
MNLTRTIRELGYGAPKSPRLQPLRAFKALRGLREDADAAVQYTELIQALSGGSTLRAFARFGAMSTGRKILRERRELGPGCLAERNHQQHAPRADVGVLAPRE